MLKVDNFRFQKINHSIYCSANFYSEVVFIYKKHLKT